MSLFAHTTAKRTWQVLVGTSRRADLVSDSPSKQAVTRETKETLDVSSNYTTDDGHRANNKAVEDEQRSWAQLRPTIANVPQVRDHFPTTLRSWAELRPGTNYTRPTINDE